MIKKVEKYKHIVRKNLDSKIEKHKTTLYIDKDLIRLAKIEAVKDFKPFTQIVEDLLIIFLEQRGIKKDTTSN